jgi:Flp pilus assembly protein TadG
MKSGTFQNRSALARWTTLATDCRGAAAVEYAAIGSTMFLLMLGIIEFMYAGFQWLSAETATHAGVRAAVVGDPVASGLKAWDCKAGNMTAGTSCADPQALTLSMVCSSTGAGTGTCAGWGGGFDDAAFTAIVDRMRALFPRIQRANVVVRYVDDFGASRLGFAGRPGGPIPLVTVELKNLNFDLIVVGALLGMTSSTIPMPAFTASLTGEDMQTTWTPT